MHWKNMYPLLLIICKLSEETFINSMKLMALYIPHHYYYPPNPLITMWMYLNFNYHFMCLQLVFSFQFLHHRCHCENPRFTLIACNMGQKRKPYIITTIRGKLQNMTCNVLIPVWKNFYSEQRIRVIPAIVIHAKANVYIFSSKLVLRRLPSCSY